MQSDVTLVGGTTPAASLPTVAAPSKVSAQAGDKPPIALAAGQSIPRSASTSQTATITEAKIALSADGSPTALSQAERVLKPYGVTMLPEPPAENGAQTDNTAQEDTAEV